MRREERRGEERRRRGEERGGEEGRGEGRGGGERRGEGRRGEERGGEEGRGEAGTHHTSAQRCVPTPPLPLWAPSYRDGVRPILPLPFLLCPQPRTLGGGTGHCDVLAHHWRDGCRSEVGGGVRGWGSEVRGGIKWVGMLQWHGQH